MWHLSQINGDKCHYSIVNYSLGYDFVNNDSIPDDEYNHGTKLNEDTMVEDNIETPNIEPIVPTNHEIFEIDLEQINKNKKSQPTNKNEQPIDIDNDGI